MLKQSSCITAGRATGGSYPAETLTQHLPNQREDGAEAPSRRWEEQPALDSQKLRERVKAAETLIQQLVTERDESRARLSVAENQNRKLKEQLAAALPQILKQRETAVLAFRKIVAERDENQAQVSEVEDRIRKLEEALTVAQEQFRNLRETTV